MTKLHDVESLRLLTERLPDPMVAALVAVGEVLDLAQLDERQLETLMHDLARKVSKRCADVRFQKETMR